MRYKRLIAVLLTAIFLVGAVVPATAGDGKHPRIVDVKVKDHPWQDENAKTADKVAKRPLGIILGPSAFTINVAIPFAQKPPTLKNVEKRK